MLFDTRDNVYFVDSSEWEKGSFYRKAKWRLSFCLFPHKCLISKKTIWLEYAYKGTAMYTGPGDPVYMTKWHSKNEHLMWVIKNYE